MRFDQKKLAIVGEAGSLPVIEEDVIAQKFAMLIEGECEGLGPVQAAEKYGYSKQRYFQIRDLYKAIGAEGLANKRRGPKSNYRRTGEIVKQIIRHRFLDPSASPAVIAQKLRQTGMVISVRSIERVIEDFGLQKKNCTGTAPIPKAKTTSLRCNAVACARSRYRAIHSVSNGASVNCYRIRSAVTWWGPGC